MHQYVLMDAICFPGDLCFRSGDILVSDEYGYLYFKVSKVWRQVSCEIPVLLFYFSSFCGFEGFVAFGLIIKYLFPNQGLHFFRGCEYESKLKSGIRIRASRISILDHEFFRECHPTCCWPV